MPLTTSATRHRDEIEIARLEQLGMKPGDESKILVLRDYILKLAQATHR